MDWNGMGPSCRPWSDGKAKHHYVFLPSLSRILLHPHSGPCHDKAVCRLRLSCGDDWGNGLHHCRIMI